MAIVPAGAQIIPNLPGGALLIQARFLGFFFFFVPTSSYSGSSFPPGKARVSVSLCAFCDTISLEAVMSSRDLL